MSKYKTEKGKMIQGYPMTACTGCCRDKTEVTNCLDFIEDREREGLENCEKGYIYLEVTND